MSAPSVEAVEKESVPSASNSSVSSATGGSSSIHTKHSLTGWDSQLRLHPAQQQAIAHLSQLIQSQSSSSLYSPLPLRSSSFTSRSADGSEQRPLSSSPPAAQLWLQTSVRSASPLQLGFPSHLSHLTWEQHLLSSYLSSSSPAASSSSPAYSLLVASHSQLASLVSLSSSLLSHLSLLHQHHALVHDKTNAVREECSALLAEQKELLAKADRYAANLYYYQQADKIAQQLQHTLTITSTSTSTSLDAASFPAILSTIDQCCDYLHINHSFHSSATYVAKYERLKEKLLRLVRQYVSESLHEAERNDRADREKALLGRKAKEATSDVTASGASSQALPSDSGRQSSWLRSFVTHRALAPQLAPLIRDIERRAADSPAKSLYSTTLAEVQQLYLQQRQRVVVAALSEYVATISRERELTALTRAAVSALLSLCSLETQLFDVLFSDVSRPLLSSLLTSLASILYTALRPVVIRQTDIDVLCEVISILKEETANSGAASISHPPVSSPSAASSASSSSSLPSPAPASTVSAESHLSILRRLIGDCQERLSYRASVFIRDQVAGYNNTQREVNYRARLDKLRARGGGQVDGSRHEHSNNNSDDHKGEQRNGKSQKEEKTVDGADDVSLAEWHPALERTLITLSKLYRCLEPNVFKILAQEAIAECLNQLTACERLIAAQPPPPQPTEAALLPSSAASLHATLWLIQQLLTLRSQLSPFPLDLSSPHKQHALDFSHMASALPSLFSSSAKWSSFSDLVQLSTPRVHEVRSDSKRAIDRLLREWCERCIAQLTHHSIGPLIAFFQRTAQKQQAGAGNDGQQFRAELCDIMDQLTAADQTGLAAVMLDLRRLVHAYLNNAMAERSLFAPVKRALMETAEQLRFFVNTHYGVAEGASEEDLRTASKLHTAISTLDRLIQSIEA